MVALSSISLNDVEPLVARPFRIGRREKRKMNFKTSVHSALWGLESWEISAHPSDPSVIADGEENLTIG